MRWSRRCRGYSNSRSRDEARDGRHGRRLGARGLRVRSAQLATVGFADMGTTHRTRAIATAVYPFAKRSQSLLEPLCIHLGTPPSHIGHAPEHVRFSHHPLEKLTF